MKITKFEELDCWRSARELVRLVYTVSNEGLLARDFGTKDQFKRAALSTMNNIAEGFGRKSDKEFIRFLDFSQSSALEVMSITYVLEDMDYLSKETLAQIRKKTEDTKRLALGMIRYLSSKTNTLKKNHK